MLKQYALASLALYTHALDVGPVIDGKKTSNNSKAQANAATDFTQANCDTANKFYVNQLPSFKTGDTWPCSYAGTVDGNADGTHQLFWWMYPAKSADAPIAIWLNGGPGASSTFANFLFSSPLRIAQKVDSTFEMSTIEQSWIDAATVIYIDQPVGTGFSYGEPLLSTTEEAAPEFVTMMKNIFKEFPVLQDKDLYMTGESYAGKYIPRFSWALHEDGGFNLKASLIGDPYTAPLTQRVHTYIVPEALNIIDDSNMPQISALQKNCQEMQTDPSKAGDTCAAIVDYVTQVAGDVYPYDNRIFAPDWDVIENPVLNYFAATNPDSNTIYTNIHVDQSTKVPIFEMGSSAVGTAFNDENMVDYSGYVAKLIAAKSPVLIYAGEFDAQDGPKTQEFWLRRLAFDGQDDFWNQSRQVYWMTNVTNPSQLLNGGYWRTSDYFEYLTVPKAGHFVPNNYYSDSFAFLTDYISGQKLTCHKTADSQCSVVAARCSAMNDCNGNGVCNPTTAQCECSAGYKFADCSKKVVDVSGDGYQMDIAMHGPGWFSMQYSGTKSTKFSLNANVTSEFYISKGSTSDPNNFVYDYHFKGVTGNMTLDADQLGLNSGSGYSVAVYCNAINETANEIYYGQLSLFLSEGAIVIGVAASVISATAATLLF